MKKRLAALAVFCALLGCSSKIEPIVIDSTVELHGEKADMGGYYWLEEGDHPFIEISVAESIRLFEEGGSGMLYYGYVGCPFCERAVPELSKAALAAEVTVYYIFALNGVAVHQCQLAADDFTVVDRNDQGNLECLPLFGFHHHRINVLEEDLVVIIGVHRTVDVDVVHRHFCRKCRFGELRDRTLTERTADIAVVQHTAAAFF
ncbi:MAG: hypothetical protein IIY73_03000, partial [Solobacterium sp.]|nr:hypothetical protein [Solobacterium sp.]